MHSWMRAPRPVVGDRRPGQARAPVAALDARSAGEGRRGEPPDGGQRRAGRGEPERGDAAADQRRARRRAAGVGRATCDRKPVKVTRRWRRRRPVEQRVRRARGVGGRHRTAGRGRAVGLDPGSRGSPRERGPRAGHQGARAGPAGHDHGRGRGPVGHPRGRRRGRVPRRRGALLRQPRTPGRRGSPWPSSSRVWARRSRSEVGDA